MEILNIIAGYINFSQKSFLKNRLRQRKQNISCFQNVKYYKIAETLSKQ